MNVEQYRGWWTRDAIVTRKFAGVEPDLLNLRSFLYAKNSGVDTRRNFEVACDVTNDIASCVRVFLSDF